MAIVSDNTDAAFGRLERQQDEFLADLGETGLEYIREETPVDTGTLRANNELEVDEAAGEIRWNNDTDYAVPVHFGHTIQSGGHVPANPFMQRGLDRLTKEADAIAERHFD
jgi:hypothetical protein